MRARMLRLVIPLCVLLAAVAFVVSDLDSRRAAKARAPAPAIAPGAAPSKPAAPVLPAALAKSPADPEATVPAGRAPAAGETAVPPSAGSLLATMFTMPGLGAAVAALVLTIVALFALRGRLRPRARAPRGMPFAGLLGAETVAAPPPSQSAGLELPATPLRTAAGLPAGFDVSGFVRAAKLNYVRLQLARDLGAIEELRSFTTPGMFDTLARELREHRGARPQSDIVSLNADVIEVATEDDRHLASVRFSGQSRETPGGTLASFEEVWNLAKPADGSSGWLLAGIQPLH